jgi:hypothetical protein
MLIKKTLYQFAFKMHDPAFGRVPRAAARKPHPQAGTRAYYKYVEESDAATTKVYT